MPKKVVVEFTREAFQQCHSLPKEAYERGKEQMARLVSSPGYDIGAKACKVLVSKKFDGEQVREIKWNLGSTPFRAEYIIKYDPSRDTILVTWVGFRRDANGSH